MFRILRTQRFILWYVIISTLLMDSMQGSPLLSGDNSSAKVWFQEKADIGKVLDLTDLEELNDGFVQTQLLR